MYMFHRRTLKIGNWRTSVRVKQLPYLYLITRPVNPCVVKILSMLLMCFWSTRTGCLYATTCRPNYIYKNLKNRKWPGRKYIIILWAVSIPILLNYNGGGVHTWYYIYGYDDREFLVYRSKLRQHTVTIIFD